VLSKKDKKNPEWITIGSDCKKIRDQWTNSSKTNLPLLIVGESGTGKSFWINESWKIRGINPENVLRIDFKFSCDLESILKKLNSQKNPVCIYILNLSHSNGEQIQILLQWWKEEKYRDNSNVLFYWEISNIELEIFESTANFSEFYNHFKSFRFELPPLKKRLADLPSFVNCFLEEASITLNKKVKTLDEDFFGFLKNKVFKNNLAELKDFIFAMVGFSDGKHYTWKQIGLHFFENQLSDYSIVPGVKLEDYEREIIKANLLYTKGNREKASKLLGISERNLYRKIHEFQLEDLS
jgi:DNA-binding NtrC family response regulator